MCLDVSYVELVDAYVVVCIDYVMVAGCEG